MPLLLLILLLLPGPKVGFANAADALTRALSDSEPAAAAAAVLLLLPAAAAPAAKRFES
jgi:hypothetical protein